MTALPNLATSSASPYLRPFDVHRDLAAVADLVELCFSDTLDPDGEHYLQQMRSAARNQGFLRWATNMGESGNLPTNGYVWEQDGRLVGNVSIIPFRSLGSRLFLIANVAVHPDYRQRGIGRALTMQAMDYARQRGAPAAWLHVRENNDPAVHIYRSLGFVERARRTTWYSRGEISLASPPAGIAIGSPRGSDWSSQSKWLNQCYPPNLTWHLQINPDTLRPGLWGELYRFLNGLYVQQWAARRSGHLLGVLSWQASGGYANTLWLAAPPESEDLAARTLLLHARQILSNQRPLVLDYHAHRAEEAIRSAGFDIRQTLIWMSVSTNSLRH